MFHQIFMFMSVVYPHPPTPQSRYTYPEQCEGSVDAGGLPASEAVRCKGVVEQSDPETRYTRRPGRPAVSNYTWIM